MPSKRYVPSRFEISFANIIAATPTPAMLRRWPASLIKRTLQPDKMYNHGDWIYLIRGIEPVHRSNGYRMHTYRIRDIMKAIDVIKCRVCYKPYKFFKEPRKSAYDRAFKLQHTKTMRTNRWGGETEYEYRTFTYTIWNPPPFFCSEDCIERENKRAQKHKNAVELRRMIHDMALEIFSNFVDEAEELYDKANRKERELKVMIMACRKILKEKMKDEKRAIAGADGGDSSQEPDQNGQWDDESDGQSS